MISNFLLALTGTIVVEVTVVYCCGWRKKEQIWLVVLINCLTNPVLNYVVWLNNYFGFVRIDIGIILFLELVVVVVEWRLLIAVWTGDSKKLLWLSLFMNLCSYGVGKLVFG